MFLRAPENQSISATPASRLEFQEITGQSGELCLAVGMGVTQKPYIAGIHH